MSDEPFDETGAADVSRPTEGVRIIGAKEAGGAATSPETGSTPVVSDADTSATSGDAPDGDGSEDEPQISEIPPVTPAETFELPHYTGPPTGQVPKVVIGEGTEASWAGLGDQPRWRDTEQHFDEQRGFTELIGEHGSKVEEHGVNAGAKPAAVTKPPTGATPVVSAPTPRPSTVFDASEDLTDDTIAAVPETASHDVGDGAPAEFDEAAPTPRRPPAPRRRPRPEAGDAPVAFGAASGSEAAGGGRNVPVAAGVGLALAGIATLCFVLGSTTTMVLITVVLCIAAMEFFTTLTRSGYQPAGLLGIAAVAGLGIAPLYKQFFAYPIILGLVTLAALAWFLFVQAGEGAVMNLGVTLLGIAYVGGLGSFATLLIGVARPFEGAKSSNQGIGILFAAILITVCNDVGAYFIGKQFGRTPLSAASPNKTQEGLLGGFLVGLVIPVLVIFAFPLRPIGTSLWTTFGFCLICAVMAPVGDLCESALKRDLKVKDMGTLLPGHGGMLDRIDGLLFVLPTAYFMAHLLNLGRPAFF